MYSFSNDAFVTLVDFGLTQYLGDLCSKLTVQLIYFSKSTFRLCIVWNVHVA